MKYNITYRFKGDLKNRVMDDGVLFKNFCNNKDVIILHIEKINPVSKNDILDEEKGDVYPEIEMW